MISQIKETIVEKKEWIDEEELMQMITVAESTPGPIAINMATYIGYKKGGVLGSVCATLGVVLPSFVIIYIISLFFSLINTLCFLLYFIKDNFMCFLPSYLITNFSAKV